MSSEWKSRSNRRNAEKSTGPKSDEGKERSRANAWKHGLSGADTGMVVGGESVEAILDRLEEWRPSFQPDSPAKEWAFEQMVINSLRIDQCQVRQIAASEYDTLRAGKVWDLDREAETAALGSKLSRKPDEVVKELRTSKYGCKWLIEQWGHLRGVLQASGSWNDEQLQRALNLTGLPREGRGEDGPENHAAIVDREVARLEALLANHLDELDAIERAAAENGRPLRLSKTVSLLRRYEAASVKRFNAAKRMLEKATLDSFEVSANPRPVLASAVPEPEPEDDDDDDDMPEWRLSEREAEDLAAQEAIVKAFSAYNKAYDAATEAERATLVPDLPASLLASLGAQTPAPAPSPVRLRDAVPAPAGTPMNRKQRRAMAKRNGK